MSTIKINDLHFTGSELFADSESYMNELGDGELEMINGGSSPACIIWSVRITVIATRQDPARLASAAAGASGFFERLSNPFNSF